MLVKIGVFIGVLKSITSVFIKRSLKRVHGIFFFSFGVSLVVLPTISLTIELDGFTYALVYFIVLFPLIILCFIKGI